MMRPIYLFFFLLEANNVKSNALRIYTYIYIGCLIFNLTMLRYKLRSSAFILGSEAIPFEPTRQYFPARLFLFLHARVFENDPIFIFTNTWKNRYRNVTRFF